MEKFSCLIVEDEPLAAEVLQEYIGQIPYLQYKGTCKSALLAMEILQKENIDVLFLDIHLPKLTGIDFIRTLKKPPQIIITTAYREYALDGYELNVTDYLLKPIAFNRFITAVNKLKADSGVSNVLPVAANAATEKVHLLININKKRIKIYLADILYVESKKEYVSIVTKDKAWLTKSTLGDVEAQLPSEQFIRLHRSFIVSIPQITAFSTVGVDINTIHIPIGRSYRELVQRALGAG